jgi:hypothetical protein
MAETLHNLEAKRKEFLEKLGDKPLTTLVPDVRGKYRNLMEEGERAFKTGLFAKAEKSFKEAQEASHSAPASLDGSMRASFALSDHNYVQAAKYLCQLLDKFPELPSINLSIRGYYSRDEDYAKHMARLEAHVKQNPKDAYAQFLLAYLKWRDGKNPEAEKAINLAIEYAKDKSLTEAIGVLVRGVTRVVRHIPKGPRPKLQAPMNYPAGGIQLALPEGFQLMSVENVAQVLRASREDGSEGKQIFTVSIYPVAEGETATSFVDHRLRDLQENQVLKDLKVNKPVKALVDGVVGEGLSLDFTDREGKEVSAMAGCFIRAVQEPDAPQGSAPVYLAYVITLETPREHKKSLLPTIDAMVRLTRFTRMYRPVNISLVRGVTLKDVARGFSIARPVGWASRTSTHEIVMGQSDFLLGGVISPMVHVGSVVVPASLSNEQCVQKVIERQKAKGYTVKKVEAGPAKLAGMDGYQFALLKSVASTPAEDPLAEKFPAAKPMTLPGPPHLETIRFVFQPVDKDNKKIYFISMICYDCDLKKCRAIMDHLAGGFDMLKSVPPATAPVTAPTTAPASAGT